MHLHSLAVAAVVMLIGVVPGSTITAKTTTFYPTQPVSGETILEVTLDVEVMYNLLVV